MIPVRFIKALEFVGVLFLAIWAVGSIILLLAGCEVKCDPRCNPCPDCPEPPNATLLPPGELRTQCAALISTEQLWRECHAEDGSWGYPKNDGGLVVCKTKEGAVIWARKVELDLPEPPPMKIKPRLPR